MTQRERERAWTEAPIGAGTRLIGEALGRRKWPLLLSCTTVVAGMLYLFFWGRVVHRGDAWTSAGDLWGIFRAAHYVGWGYLGGVYDPSTGFISLPGMPTLLAPVAVLSGSLHLTESAMPNFLQRPRAVLILEPAELVLASTVLFAADALAERLAVTSRNRLVLSILVAMVAWPVVAIWGHGEDVLALTLAGYALLAVLNGRWARGGWLLGLGIAVQPLVALLVPLVVGVTPAGQRLRTLVRSAAISVVLVGVAAAGDLHDTLRAVVEQPTPPSINHATPWVFLARTRGIKPASGDTCFFTRPGNRTPGELYDLCAAGPDTRLGWRRAPDRCPSCRARRVLCVAAPATSGAAHLARGGNSGVAVLLRGGHDAVLPGPALDRGPGPCCPAGR